jgi:hypothetical protein|tara:strand:- start:2552 stop:3346 length:795 start_codon:yes stop_codon:yes gene_type:complete
MALSKGKKRTESVMQRQARLLREQRARIATGSKNTKTVVEGVADMLFNKKENKKPAAKTKPKNEIKSSKLRKAIKEVKKRPDPNPASRGAQGPRNAPQQGPSRAVKGTIGSRPAPTPSRPKPPRVKGAPRIAGGTGRTVYGRSAADSAARRASRSARPKIKGGLKGSSPYILAAEIIANDIANRSVADGTLKGKPVPQKKGPPAPKAKKSKAKSAFKPPSKSPAKNKAVLAKKKGKTGSKINDVFYPHAWSAKQRLRYAARGGK